MSVALRARRIATSSALRARRTARDRARRRGDTLIEIMVALVVLAIGVLGISSLQGFSARSNRDAQETSVALTFARTWLERVRRDAVAWTTPALPAPGTLLVGRAAGDPNYFVPTPPAANVWSTPWPLHAGESAGANARGIDVGAPVEPGSATLVQPNEIYYCAEFKFDTVYVDAANPEVVRATVRVWWTRNASPGAANYTVVTQMRENGRCAPLPAGRLAADNDLRVVYLSTLLASTT